LSGIELAAIWPILRMVCHDIALYLGGSAMAGATVGGGLGFFVFGVGVIPGAVAGTAIGTQIGSALLGFLGLKSVVGYMIESIPRAAEAYQSGLKDAWGIVPDLRPGSPHAPHYFADQELYGTWFAARELARGHEIVVMALLTGIVAYLTRGRGNLST
jgi:hypothetical protein